MLVPDSLQVDEKRPVMIWIHGGAFLTGSGAGNDVPANQVRYQNNNERIITFIHKKSKRKQEFKSNRVERFHLNLLNRESVNIIYSE